MKDNDFKFYLPVDEIEKGKDSKGEEVFKFKGLASTDKEDADGEFLDYNGFLLDQFNVVNWNHRSEPKYIIGEPTKAKIIPNKGLFVEGVIYPTEIGNQVAELMKAMKNNSTKGNKLGISVEGKALERDSINPKRVVKAKITGMAICPIPKNGDTWAELIEKGFKSDIEKVDDFDIQKSANGGETYIIDVLNPETGMRYMVDKNFNIKVEKAMTTQSGSGKPLMPESLEGKVKKLNDIQKSAIITLAKAVEQGKLIIKSTYNKNSYLKWL